MRYRSISTQYCRRISANAEKRCAGEVQHPRIAELNVQPKRRDAVEQNRDDEKHHKMIVMKIGGDCDDGEDRTGAQHVLALHERTAQAVEKSKPCNHRNRGDAETDERNNELLTFRCEKRNQIKSCNGERSQAGP